MQLSKLTEDLALLLPIVILVEGIIGVVVWFGYGSRGGRGARVATWLGLVTLTVWVGSAAAFVLLHMLYFAFGSVATIIGAIGVTAFMLLMPFGWAAVIRHHGTDTDQSTHNGPQAHGPQAR
jgi:hypothetical protein